MKWGISIFIGPGYIFHWSTEEGIQKEQADHRTWRLGFLIAIRRKKKSHSLSHKS